jgi:adenine-specific DNA-methyltransferase
MPSTARPLSRSSPPVPTAPSRRIGQSETKQETQAMNEDVIDACVMECYFRKHMAERDLLFHATVAPHLAKVEQRFLSAASSDQSRHECLNSIHHTLNAPSHPIRNRNRNRNRLDRLSPDLLAIIKKGRQSLDIPIKL